MTKSIPKTLKKLIKQSGHKLIGIEQKQGERFFIISTIQEIKKEGKDERKTCKIRHHSNIKSCRN